MDTFDNFDTDYSGMNRFKDIMEHGGNIDMDRLKDFIKNSVNELADEGQGAVKHLEFGNGLSVVIAWEEAASAEDDGTFVDGGYEICASVRETESAPRIEEWKSLVGSVALTEEDEANGFADIAEELYVQIMDNDPETSDTEGQVREETIFDELDDFSGSFKEWKDRIEADGEIQIADMRLEKVSANDYVDYAVVFEITEDIVEADMESIDEYFTRFMPQSIVDFVEDKDFNFSLEGKREIAFIVW